MFFPTIAVQAQNTQGYKTQQVLVKTRGYYSGGGKRVAGRPLADVIVSIKDINSYKTDKNGRFSFSLASSGFFIQSVSKSNYVLLDPDILFRRYSYSPSTQIIVLVKKEELPGIRKERKQTEEKLQKSSQTEYDKRFEKLDEALAEGKISPEKYRAESQRLLVEQRKIERSIKEIAERYSKIDWDQEAEILTQIAHFIKEGDLKRADSLLNSKGNAESMLKEISEEGATVQQTQRQLDQAKSGLKKKIAEFGDYCYSKREIFLLKGQLDSAAKYMNLRAKADTTNYEWQMDYGGFCEEYLADYATAWNVYSNVLKKAEKYNNQAAQGDCINSLGIVCERRGKYDEALEYYTKALSIREKVYGPEHPLIASCYNNIANIYNRKSEYLKALDHYNSALEISRNYYGEDNVDLSSIYNNMGVVYRRLGDNAKSMEYYRKALDLRLASYGEEHPDVANCYHNIASSYERDGDYQKALEYYLKALNIRERVYGSNHPSIAVSYYSLGCLRLEMGDNAKAKEYLNESLRIWIKVYGQEHPDVVMCRKTLEKIK